MLKFCLNIVVCLITMHKADTALGVVSVWSFWEVLNIFYDPAEDLTINEEEIIEDEVQERIREKTTAKKITKKRSVLSSIPEENSNCAAEAEASFRANKAKRAYQKLQNNLVIMKNCTVSEEEGAISITRLDDCVLDKELKRNICLILADLRFCGVRVKFIPLDKNKDSLSCSIYRLNGKVIKDLNF